MNPSFFQKSGTQNLVCINSLRRGMLTAIQQRKELPIMQIQAISKGIAVGAAAGMLGYLVSSASTGEKSKLKRRTVKAAHAIGAVMDSVAALMH